MNKKIDEVSIGSGTDGFYVFFVVVGQGKTTLTPDEARAFAGEIVKAADVAERCEETPPEEWTE